MSKDWFADIADMHHKFGVNKWLAKQVEEGNWELLRNYIDFRVSMHAEEHNETMDAVKAKDSEEVVDGIIDNIVFLIGTLEVMGVDGHKAWDAVHNANMAKNPGVKEGRPNPWGLPDLIKPEKWQAPSHDGNHGKFTEIFENSAPVE